MVRVFFFLTLKNSDLFVWAGEGVLGSVAEQIEWFATEGWVLLLLIACS